MTKQDLIKKLDQTKKASLILGLSSVSQRNSALFEIARILKQNQTEILQANQKDAVKLAKSNPMLDRIILTKPRLASTIKDIKTVIKLECPLKKIIEQRKLQNSLMIKKISVPFGVIAVIYEARPNVTVDAVSLCLKSGNAIILKGGKDAWATNQILVKLMQKAIAKAGFSQDLVLNINPEDRYLVKHLLSAKDYIDLIIPPVLGQRLAGSKVEIFADSISHKILKQSKYPYLQKAKKTDFGKEFLSLKMAVKTVKDIDDAILYISKYSTKHSEAIIAEDRQNAQRFLQTVDAACVYHNASTRFTDGSEFGMGGEIGISTQKLHTRGPMSVKELTTYKWVAEGSGQVR